MKEYIVTPYSIEYEEEIVNKIIEAIKKDQQYILLLPTKELLNHYRIKILEKIEVVFSLNIKTFDDFLLEHVRDPKKEELFQSLMIRLAIERAFNENLIERNSYYFSEGFVSLSRKFIMDLKSSLKSNKIDKLMKNNSLKDFGIIFKIYEELLEKHNYKDIYDIYNNIHLENSWDLVIINGFYEFRPIEEKIIKNLTKKSKEFYFYFQMPLHSSFTKYCELGKTLDSLGFKKREIFKNELNAYETLSKGLLEGKRSETEVQVIEAGDLYQEIYYTAVKILESGEENFKGIGVLVEDKNTLNMVRKVFYQLNIPSNIYYKETLFSNIKIKEFKSLLEVKNEREFLLSYLKSSFIKVEQERQEGILYLVKILNSLSNYSFEEIEELENFQELILNYQLESVLMDGKEKFEDYRDSSFIIKKLTKILKDIGNDLSNQALEYIDEFQNFFCSLSYNSLKSFLLMIIEELEETISLEGVFVGNMLQVRNKKFEKLYILQMTNQVFPNLPKINTYYNERNLKNFKSCEVNLLSHEDYFEINKMRFLDTISSTIQELYLLYSCGEEESPSIYIDEIKKIGNIRKFDFKLKDYLDPEIILDQKTLRRKNILLGKEKLPKIYEKYFYKKQDDKLNREYLRNYLTDKDSFSASELETYYKCPKKYYYKYVLNLNFDEKTDHLYLGVAAHKIFENFFKVYNEEIFLYLNDEDTFFKGLEDFIEQQLYRHLKGEIFDLKLKNYINLYRNLIKASLFIDLDDLKSHHKVFYPVEYEKDINYQLEDYKIHGRVDRIERSLDGDLSITDFKLSKSNSAYGDLKDPKSLQLAIYYLSNPEKIKYLRHVLIRGKEINQYYISEDITKNSTNIDEKEVQEGTSKLLIEIIENILDGNFIEGSNIEGKNGYNICKYCSYIEFCHKRSI